MRRMVPGNGWSHLLALGTTHMSDMTNLRHKDWNSMSEDQKEIYLESMKNWRSWGSWFSWGSPVGLGLWFISVGVTLVLLHYAGIW